MSLFGKKKASSGDLYVPTDVKTVGSYGTCRYPIAIKNQDGSITNGFFSEEQEIPSKLYLFQTTMEDCKARFPSFTAYISLLESYEYEAAYEYCKKLIDLTGEELRPIFSEIVQKIGGTPHLAEHLMELDSFYFDHQDILYAIILVHERSKNYIDDMQLKPGEPILCRNIGMYRMAQLLGIDHLIAKAYPMNLSYRGRSMSGVFMENHEGVDLGHLKVSDENAILWGRDAIRNKKANLSATAIREVSDIGILDYICCNIDRHGANFLYTIEEVDGAQQLTHVFGIDNDISFGIPTLENENMKHLTALNRIRFISSSLYKRVMELKEDDVYKALHKVGVFMDEQDAVVRRLQLLQACFDQDKEQHIQVLEEEEFPKYVDDLIRTDDMFYAACEESYLRVQDRLDGSDDFGAEDRVIFTPAFYL